MFGNLPRAGAAVYSRENAGIRSRINDPLAGFKRLDIAAGPHVSVRKLHAHAGKRRAIAFGTLAKQVINAGYLDRVKILFQSTRKPASDESGYASDEDLHPPTPMLASLGERRRRHDSTISRITSRND